MRTTCISITLNQKGEVVTNRRIGLRWKRLSIAAMLAASALGGTAVPLAAQGRPADVSLSIPPQSLAEALTQFAQQAQIGRAHV